MAKGQQLPITEELHNKVHAFFSRFYEMTEDGRICEEEQEEALDTLDAITLDARYVMESQAQALAIARRGFNSKMAIELQGRARSQVKRLEGSVA